MTLLDRFRRLKIPQFSTSIYGKLPCHKEYFHVGLDPAFSQLKSKLDRDFEWLIRSGTARPYVLPDRRFFIAVKGYKNDLAGCIWESDDGLRAFPFIMTVALPKKFYQRSFVHFWQCLDRIWSYLEAYFDDFRNRATASEVYNRVRGVAHRLEPFKPEDWRQSSEPGSETEVVLPRNGDLWILDLAGTTVALEQQRLRQLCWQENPGFILWPGSSWRNQTAETAAYFGRRGIEDLRAELLLPTERERRKWAEKNAVRVSGSTDTNPTDELPGPSSPGFRKLPSPGSSSTAEDEPIPTAAAEGQRPGSERHVLPVPGLSAESQEPAPTEEGGACERPLSIAPLPENPSASDDPSAPADPDPAVVVGGELDAGDDADPEPECLDDLPVADVDEDQTLPDLVPIFPIEDEQDSIKEEIPPTPMKKTLNFDQNPLSEADLGSGDETCGKPRSSAMDPPSREPGPVQEFSSDENTTADLAQESALELLPEDDDEGGNTVPNLPQAQAPELERLPEDDDEDEDTVPYLSQVQAPELETPEQDENTVPDLFQEQEPTPELLATILTESSQPSLSPDGQVKTPAATTMGAPSLDDPTKPGGIEGDSDEEESAPPKRVAGSSNQNPTDEE